MRHKTLIIVIIAAFSIILSGCRAGMETDDVAYITAMGIDQAEEGKLKFTFQVMIPRAVGGTQGPGQEAPTGPTVTNTIVAPNLFEARNLLSSSMSRSPNLSHMRTLLISEELARSGIGDIIVAIKRYREFRGGVFIVTVRGKAEEFMTANKPSLDYLPTKFYETFFKSGEEANLHLRTEVHDFYLRLKNPGGSPFMTLVGLNPRTGENKPAGNKRQSDPTDPYLAKDIPRTGNEKPTEFAGTAIFSGDKMVGALDTKETRILAMLDNKLQKSAFTLDDPLEPQKQISLFIRNGSKPKIDVDLIDGQETININVFLEGEIMTIESSINYEKAGFRELVEEAVSNLVKEEIHGFVRHTQSLGSDVYGFGYHLRNHFATYRELSKTNLPDLYKNAKVEVQVTTKLRRMGLMWRTSPNAPTVTSE